MARVTELRCDRCNQSAEGKAHTIRLDDRKMDICDPCFNLVKHWLGRSNITSQGDSSRPKSNRGPGWREVCPHHIPCAGPCPDAHYART